jgi:translation elongation factor EF-Tu-like GTPase
MAIRPPDIEAEIMFIPAEQGGRNSAAITGYRPSHDFGSGGMLDAAHEYIGCQSVAPGQTTRANMWFLAPLYQEDSLCPGMEFTVREGERVVGYGIVIKIIHKASQPPA